MLVLAVPLLLSPVLHMWICECTLVEMDSLAYHLANVVVTNRLSLASHDFGSDIRLSRVSADFSHTHEGAQGIGNVAMALNCIARRSMVKCTYRQEAVYR